MMPNNFDNRLSALLKNRITPLLKAFGFHKNQGMYVKDVDGLEWLIDIQKSQWNDETEVQFTVNCGVYVPGVFSTYANRPEPAKRKIEHCCCYVRAGMLMPEKKDIWWKLGLNESPATDIEIGQELDNALTDVVVPFLRKFDAPAAVAAFLSSELEIKFRHIWPASRAQRFSYAAIIYSRIGEERKADELLALAIEAAAKSPIKEIISSLQERISTRINLG